MGRRTGPSSSDRGARVLALLALLLVAVVGGALSVALGTFEFADDGTTSVVETAEAAMGPTGAGGTNAVAAANAAAKRKAKAGPATAVAGAGSVRGQVRLFKTREPVAGFAVALKPAEGAALGATTDASGVFEFRSVPAGPGWELRGEQKGFAPVEVTGIDLAPDQALDLGVLWLAVPVDLPALVVDTTGKPVEGAEVAAFAMGRTLPDAQDEWSAELREQRTLALAATPRPSRTAKTDAQGRAVVSGLMPGAYRAVASAPKLAPASRSNLLLVPDAKVEPLRFVLGPAHALEGTVTDLDGKPVAKASVIAALRQGWLPSLDKSAGDTADDGRYRVEGLAAGSYFVYLAREGRPLLQVGEVCVPESSRFDIRLRPGGTIRGRVTDEDGKGVPGADIHASMQSTWAPMSAKTDKDGQFALLDVPAGPLAYFRVTASGFIPFPDPAARRQGAGESLREGQVMVRDVTLRRGCTAVFTVVGEGKGPLEGVEVRLHLAAQWSGGVRPWKAFTDAKGRAEITGLLPGEHLAMIVAEGWVAPGLPRSWENIIGYPVTFPDPYRVTIPPEGTLEREFRLTRGTSVAGTVLDPSGKPVAGAVVELEAARREFPIFSGEGGAFRFDNVPPLRRAVATAKTSSGAAGSSDPFVVRDPGGADNVEVRLKEPGRITGTVRTRSGRPPAGAVVRWVAEEISDGAWWEWQQVDTAERHPVSAEGAFEIPGVPAGKVTVRADAEGCLPATQIVTVTSGVESGGIQLLLDAPRAIRGRAQTQQGAPVAGATVSCDFQGRLSGQGSGYVPGFSGMPKAQTGPDGTFALEGLLEGRYTLWAAAPGFAGGAYAQTSTDAGEVLLTFATGKPVSGTVKDPEGNPLAGIPVMAERADGTQGRTNRWWGQMAYTAPDGTFELQDLAEGNYRLKVSGAWQWGREVNVEDTVREGVAAGDRNVEIVVRAGLVIEGRLVDKEKQPVRVGWVSAQYRFEGGEHQWGTERWVQVRSDGTFRVAGLRPGPYQVGAYGAFRQQQPATVAAGTRDVEIVVQDAWLISGVLLDEKGVAVDGFNVKTKRDGQSDWEWSEYVQPGDGEFVVVGLEEARYDLQLTSGGHAPAVVTNVPAGTRGLTVRIGKGLELGGTVVDAGGRPMAEVWVAVESTKLEGDGAKVSTGAQTDASGRFRVGGLAPGTYRITARLQGQGLAPTIVRGVAAGSDDVRIALVAGTTITGKVVDGEGVAFARARVWLLAEDDVQVAYVRTDESGNFEFRDVPPDGRWKVRVRGRDNVDRVLEQTVESGATDVKLEVK